MAKIKKIVNGTVVEVEDKNPIVKTIVNGVVVEKPLDDLKKKEVSGPVLETGGGVGTSEPPLRKEKVLDYLAALKTPAVVTGKAPTIPKEKAILPVQKPKKIDTSFGLTKEKIKVDISPKVEEISFDADPIGLAQRKASETKNLQEATDYLSAAEVFKQLSVPSGYQAYVRSASPLIDKNTATGSAILERGGRYGATTEGLRQIKAPDLSTANEEFIRQNIIPQIERAAVIYKVRANPSFEKELKAVNTSVDDPNLRSVLGSAKMGSIMEEFLNNPDVASFAREENPNLSIALQYARDKNFDLNKEWGISSVANKVSREFERSEKRGSAFAPFATESLKKDIDEVAKQKLNPEEYDIYQTYIKGNEEQYLDTPSFLGGFAEGGKGVFEGILNTIEKVTGFAPPKEDVIRSKWREEAMNVSANPEGLRNIVAESGKVGGLVAALYGTGGLIRGALGVPAAGTGLPATTLTTIADATNVATAFLGDMIDEGVIKYPTEPVKAYTSAIFNTLVFMAMGKDIFPGAKVKSAFSKVQPEVEQVVKNLANGSISREAARQELNTIGKKAIDIAAAGVSQNAKISAELTGLSVLNEGLDILMDMDEDKLRKYYPEGVHGDTFKTMFLSNALVSSIAGYGKVKRDNTIARESIYEAASNPKRYSRIIEDLVIKDPNITKEELLNNLSFAVETKRLLDQRGIPTESQKKYLVKALGERVAIAEKEKIADSTLRKEAEDKIKQAQAEKEAILTAPEEALEVPTAPEITDTEYTEFIDKGTVTPERLNDIAQKVKNKEALSEREQAIFADKTADINKIIGGEVAPEAAPEVPAAKIENPTVVITGTRNGLENLESNNYDPKTGAKIQDVRGREDQFQDNVLIEEDGKGNKIVNVKVDAIDSFGRRGFLQASVVVPKGTEIDAAKVKAVVDAETQRIKDKYDGSLELGRVQQSDLTGLKNAVVREVQGVGEVTPKAAPELPAAFAKSRVQDAIDKYDEGDISTINDLVDEIEAIADEEGNQVVLDAVEEYREEQRYNESLKGRGDMDAAEDAFLSKIRGVGEVAPEAAPQVPAAPKVEAKKAEYKREDFPEEQMRVDTPITQKLVNYLADVLGVPRINIADGKYVSWVREQTFNFKDAFGGENLAGLEFALNAPRQVFDRITKFAESASLGVGEVAPEAAPQVPAAPIEEEELPFGEVAPREQKKQREITNRTKRALNIEITDNPIGEVLQYFLGGGKVNPDAMDELFGRKKQGYRWEGNESKVKQERKLRRQLLDKNAPSIEALAEKIAGTDRLDQTQDYRNAIEEVLLSHSRRETMADELVDSFDTEYAEKMRQEELEELGKAAEEEAKYITSLVPEAQREEIAKVLDRFRKANGRVDWSEMERELEGGFEPILLDLSEQSQKFINDAIEQIKSTGRISGVPIEALPAAEEKGRAEAPPPKIEAAEKRAEARKELRDAFNDLMNLGVVYDPRSQAEKQVRLTKAIINVIKQEAIGAIKDLKKYIKDNVGFDISDNDAKYLLIESKKPEYAIQEPAAGVPPTRPPKAPEEGKVEGEEEVEYTPREKEKALLNKLYKAKNIPEDAKIGFEKEGLKYQTKSQKEAELIANGVIDEIGIDDALELADSLKFDGDVNSLIYAESLNRLSKMEREAKSPEEKRALAKKFAEVGIEYGIKSQYGGRFNAAISYFYQKSPLGIVLMEDMKRKQEFDKFAKNKEQYWKEAHDIIKAELDALKLELESKKADPSIKTSEAKIMAARLKRAALKEKYKKGKGGGLTLTTGGLTKEGIEYVGELVATYIEEGIANVEVIVQRIFLDLKDVTAKDLDEKTANQVEEEVRKKYKETKGKSTLNKIRKKLEKLSKKKQDEVIRKSFNQIIESGGLDYDDFRKIIAETTGYPELTDQEKVRLEELVTKTNAVERMAEKAREDRTEQSLKDFRRAEMEAGKAARELNQLVWNKPDILKRLTSIMQLSTLGIPALINNPIYNIWNQATLRFPVGLINDLVDRGMTLAAQATGTEYQREYNAIDTQKEFFKKLGFGAKESVEQMITGLSRQDYIQKEVGGQQIQPLQAAKDWWASFTGKKRLTSAQMLDKFIQATAGVPAEAIARTLNIGDKPQRFAAEGAQASAFAKSFGLKDLDYKLFIEFPREEAFRIYKSKGLSDAEAAQKAEYIKDVILKEGQRATFQQDNLLNTAISALFNTIFGKGKETGLANLVKTVTVSPYIKIPANAYWSYYNLVNPEIALLQSFVHGGRAFYLNKSGEKNQAKLALRESRYWLAHSITGMAMKAVVIALVKAAVYNPGSDEEESKREREGKAFFEGQGTINIDKLNAVLAGEDPTQVKNGLLIPNRWFGQWGTVGNAIARKYENMTPEQRKNEADYYDFMLGELSTDVLQEMEQGIFANTSSLLSLLQTGNLNRYLTNTLNMFTNIVHPAAIAQISRAEIPNFTTQKADSFLKELENAMLTRSSFLRDLTGKYPPSKIGIWGEPIAKQGGTVQKLFNITKVNKDMFARPLYDDAKKYNDINFFPPAVTSSLNGKQLTVAQTRALQEFVGKARKARIAPYINDSAIIEGYSIKYSDLKDPEDKKKVLNYLYEMGRRDGLEKFYNQYKDLKPEEKTEDFLKELQFDLFKTLQKYK